MAIGVQAQPRPAPSATPGAWAASITGVFNLLNTAVQQFGWPGVILCGIGWFIVRYGTPDQKQRLIEVYALGHGTPYAVILISVVFVLVVWAQSTLHNRKVKEIVARCSQAES